MNVVTDLDYRTLALEMRMDSNDKVLERLVKQMETIVELLKSNQDLLEDISEKLADLDLPYNSL